MHVSDLWSISLFAAKFWRPQHIKINLDLEVKEWNFEWPRPDHCTVLTVIKRTSWCYLQKNAIENVQTALLKMESI